MTLDISSMEKLGAGRQADVYAISDTECVKLFHKGYGREAIENEAKIMQIAASANVGAPEYYGITEIDGRIGIRMERLNGKTMLAATIASPDKLEEYCTLLGTRHREIHRAIPEGLPALEDVLKGGIMNANGLTEAEKEAMARAVDDMPKGDRLVHLDYHADNVIITPEGARVIDWCGCAKGNPYADAARTMMTMELPSYPPDISEELRGLMDMTRAQSRECYLRGYGGDIEKIEAWRPIIAAFRLCCCPEEERIASLRIVREFLA